MFEKIVLRRSEDGQLPTLGDLAEALLFYRRVHLILDLGTTSNFLKLLGVEQFLQLLDRGNVSAVYCRETLATSSRKIGALRHHQFSALELLGHNEPKIRDRAPMIDIVQEIIQRSANNYSNRAARKLGERFLEKIPVRSLTGKDFNPRGPNLIEQATADLYDNVFITEALSSTLQHTPGFVGFHAPLSIEILPTHAGFTVFSNFDFSPTNEARARMTPALHALDDAFLVNEIFTARADVTLASHYGSDFKTSLVGSSIINLKYRELMKSAGIHEAELTNFQNVVVNEGRSLKEVIDKGERSFGEFLALLDKAKLFQNWASGIHPDRSMIAEYLKEGSREGWIASLPGKGLRFVIGGALDLGLPGSGTAFGLADSLLLEKIMKGWRPSHFVDRRLKPFVNG